MIASAVKGRGGRGETRQQADRWMERKDSGVEDDDPFSQQTLELGLGTDSRLQKETVVLDISMEKRLDRHWQARGWQPRRVVLTGENVFFFKEDSPHQIVDLIPLLEISTIELEPDVLAATSRPTMGRTASAMGGANMLTEFRRKGDKFIHRIGADLNGKELSGAGLDKAIMKATLPQSQFTAATSPHDTIARSTSRMRETDGEQDRRQISVHTVPDGPFGGAVYLLRCSDQAQAHEWVQAATKCREKMSERFGWWASKNLIQRRLQKIYTNPYCQTLVAALIMANFCASMVELQMRGMHLEIFKTLDVAFTVIFLLELLLNMSCNWFWGFWGSAFNVFDFVVVVVTTISLLPYFDFKVISTLRLLRAFRVVRIFGRLGSARRIIIALASSFGPVCNVLIVVTGMMSVFAMFGATAYSDAPRFYTFSDAMYTMFLTLCLDGWADLVESTEEFYPPSSGTLPPKLFFIAYIFVIVFILMPVFVAAILDGYRTSAYLQSKADAKNRGRKAMEEHVPQFSYDAILHGLLTCFNKQQLHDKYMTIFQVLDTDESGSVSFEEMKLGFHKIASTVSKSYLTLEEFESLSKNGAHLDDEGCLSFDNFCLAMDEQLRDYSKRKLSQYIVAMGEDDPGSEIIMFALKILLADAEQDAKHKHSAEAGLAVPVSHTRPETVVLASSSSPLHSEKKNEVETSSRAVLGREEEEECGDEHQAHDECQSQPPGSTAQDPFENTKLQVQNPAAREAWQTATEGFIDCSLCQHCGMSPSYAVHLGKKIDLVLSRLGMQAGSVVARGMQPDLAISFSTRGAQGNADAAAKLLQPLQFPTHLLRGADESVDTDPQINMDDTVVGDRKDQAQTPMAQESRRDAIIQSTMPRLESRARARSPKKQRQREASRRGRQSDERGTSGDQKQSNSASGERENLPRPVSDYVSGSRQQQISPGLPSLQLGFSRP